MNMSFRTVFDTPSYMDEPEPTGEEWKLEAFESFLDKYSTQIEFLVEATQSTKKLMEEPSFTEKKWEDLITKILKVTEDVYYYAETYSYDGWDINLRTEWHKFWYSV